MKKLFFISLLLLATSAFADDKKWDAVDGTLFSGFIGLQIVDAVQTMEAKEHGFKELNPIIGSNPTYPKLLLLKGAMTGGVYWLLKDMNSVDRKLMLGVLDALYIGVVAHNYSIGVRVGF